MNPQHLSDEAVAAFADGVLTGHARERAARHTDSCAECRHAVAMQREATLVLRRSPAPSLPTALFDRLRTLPQTTPIPDVPAAIAADGTPMFATFAPMAALVPNASRHSSHRVRTYVSAAAAVALAGALTAGSVAHEAAASNSGTGHTHTVRHVSRSSDGGPVVVNPVNLFRGGHP